MWGWKFRGLEFEAKIFLDKILTLVNILYSLVSFEHIRYFLENFNLDYG